MITFVIEPDFGRSFQVMFINFLDRHTTNKDTLSCSHNDPCYYLFFSVARSRLSVKQRSWQINGMIWCCLSHVF